MCEADIDVGSPASTGVDDDSGKQLHETSKDQESFQCGKRRGADFPVPGVFAIRLRNDIVQRFVGANGIVTSVKSTGNGGGVRGGRPVDGLHIVVFIETDGFGRRAGAFGGRELVRVGGDAPQFNLLEFILALIGVSDESSVLGL